MDLDQWDKTAKFIDNNIPENRVGDFEIIRVDGETFLVEHAEYLKIWMSTGREEYELYEDLYKQLEVLPNSRILMAGLGLGVDLRNIVDMDNVTDITVVEKSDAVLALVGIFIKHPKVELINDDIFEFLKNTTEKFDVIYFDIFPGGRSSYPEEAEKLAELASYKLNSNGKIIFWEEQQDV